jgi:radical SAM superfamily enzyme YgiQ (UPF0313 family)
MAQIVLATLNAKYIHAAFGLRYLLANLGDLRPEAELLEFDLNQRPLEIVEALLRPQPRIVGLGVYIWNVSATTAVVRLLKRLRPEIAVVLGGPEVSYEPEDQDVVRHANFVITGEADLTFAQVCRDILAGRAPATKVIVAPLPDLSQLVLPYDEYTDDDVAHRLVYVEASRGCPFECEFCLSSLDIPVRQVPLPPLLERFGQLLRRGVRQFKFVDRTFNLNLEIARRILAFFHERYQPGLFLHFEMIPDRLPEGLREWIVRFPPGALQFEVGIQTFNSEVSARIRRRQDAAVAKANLRFLREQTGAHLHVDLIAGLPGESLDSFALGFDQLVALQPQEIQVGILKRLRGTSIGRHDPEWGMVYSPDPPYEVLENRLLDFGTLQRLRRFARVWDLVANSGNFQETSRRLWLGAASPFVAFLRWSDWLHAQVGRQHAIALNRLARCLLDYLTAVVGQPPAEVIASLQRDFQRASRQDLPPFLRADSTSAATATPPRPAPAPHSKRQRRHGSGPPPPAVPPHGDGRSAGGD